MRTFENEMNDFLKNISKAHKTSTIDLLKIDENTLAVIGLKSIKILTETQKEMVELLIQSPRTGAQLAKLTEKSPQFISKIMKSLVKYQIVDHIPAPFGPSKFYALKANILGKEDVSLLNQKAIPEELQTEIEERGVLGNLMSLSFKEILDMIRDLDESDKQKVLDFIIEYCQVEEESSH
ncbi:MAG: hypothetical protein GF308_13610 [Candidatus Heimdallarchaeota archaeon]|nr:hypothetical protein [Candidatus Heimdallarchaeota archaeon]